MLKAVDIKWDVTDYDDDEFDDEACEVLESLPTEMDIPEGMTDPDEISDWLSDETGFCHDGFRIIDQNGNNVNLAQKGETMSETKQFSKRIQDILDGLELRAGKKKVQTKEDLKKCNKKICLNAY